MMLRSADLLHFGTKHVPEGHVISIRKTVPASGYRAFIADSVAELQERAVAARFKIAGAPFAVFHDRLYWDRDVDVEICLPVRAAIFGKHPALQTVEETTVAFVHVPRGAGEDEIETACESLERYVCDNDWIFDGDVREVYLRAPASGIEIQMPVDI